MSLSVLICDDSSMARKQMARSLPKDWAGEVNFACHGGEAMTWLRQNPTDVLFLDLTMPEMDGYQVLEAIGQEGIAVKTIVVSGDIQPEAQQRVKSLGALEFVQKPVSTEQIHELIERFQLVSQGEVADAAAGLEVSLHDCYQEVVNVAMGQAADRLARLLGVFVKLPVPKVNILEPTELEMALQAVSDQKSLSAVCQGFIGSGISGEAMVLFSDADFSSIGQLMNFTLPLSDSDQLDVLMDVSNILISACLRGVAEQLDVEFSQGHPVILGQHCSIDDLISALRQKPQRLMAIEINYDLEDQNITCDLLLLFTADSMPALDSRVRLILE
ncbi:response regulator [Balneatrix alpica]|uniref:Response regulator n=1 Tax=Balneatrix alpica TaxID=75684 RepID=A0ABV5Z8D0_9GAMM|nr:response regulator [Balneatrix alpica]